MGEYIHLRHLPGELTGQCTIEVLDSVTQQLQPADLRSRRSRLTILPALKLEVESASLRNYYTHQLTLLVRGRSGKRHYHLVELLTAAGGELSTIHDESLDNLLVS